MRWLKPIGRLVVSDLHFDSFIWHSDNPERMSKLVSFWDKHFVSGTLPERLRGILKTKGHEVDVVTPVTLLEYELKPDGTVTMMIHLTKQFAIANTNAEEAQAWFDEQQTCLMSGAFSSRLRKLPNLR